MRCALYVPNFGTFGEVSVTVALAQTAEANGWDGFFIWDHILPDADAANEPVADPWVMLASIAAATSRIRIGALVTPLPRRRPWSVARATATLDHIAQGRLVVGAGIGGDWWREYSAFGESGDAKLHGAQLDEALAVMAGLWSGQPFRFSGAHYTVDEARFLPTPVQTPRIPIWLAGVWPGTRPFRRAAEWDGVFPIGRSGDVQPDDVRALLAYVDRYRTAASAFDVVVGGRAHERSAGEVAPLLAEYAAAGTTWWLESFWAEAQAADVRAIIERGPPTTW